MRQKHGVNSAGLFALFAVGALTATGLGRAHVANAIPVSAEVRAATVFSPADPTDLTHEARPRRAGSAVLPSEVNASVLNLTAAFQSYRDRGSITESECAEFMSAAERTRDVFDLRMRDSDTRPAADIAYVICSADRLMRPDRARALVTILRANAVCYSTSCRVASSGETTCLSFSSLSFSYVPGCGWQLRPSAVLHQALLDLDAGKKDAFVVRALEIDSLAVTRGNPAYRTIEYYFPYREAHAEAGWVSSISQSRLAATEVHLGRLLQDPVHVEHAFSVLEGLRRPLGAGGMAQEQPDGGAWFPMYPSAPQMRILNGQLTVALNMADIASATSSVTVRSTALDTFRSADVAIRKDLPGFDTGTWSRYSAGGRDARLDYHMFHVSALGRLSKLVAQPGPYASSARRFAAYAAAPSVASLTTRHASPVSPNGDALRDTALFRFRTTKPGILNVYLTRTGSYSVKILRGAWVNAGATRLRLPAAFPRAGLPDGPYTVRARLATLPGVPHAPVLTATARMSIDLRPPVPPRPGFRVGRARTLVSFLAADRRRQRVSWSIRLLRGGRVVKTVRSRGWTRPRRFVVVLGEKELRQLAGPGNSRLFVRIIVADPAYNGRVVTLVLPRYRRQSATGANDLR